MKSIKAQQKPNPRYCNYHSRQHRQNACMMPEAAEQILHSKWKCENIPKYIRVCVIEKKICNWTDKLSSVFLHPRNKNTPQKSSLKPQKTKPKYEQTKPQHCVENISPLTKNKTFHPQAILKEKKLIKQNTRVTKRRKTNVASRYYPEQDNQNVCSTRRILILRV